MANVHINLYKVGTVVLYYDEKHVPDNSGIILDSTTYQDEFGHDTIYTILPTDPEGRDKGETTVIVVQSSIFAEITI